MSARGDHGAVRTDDDARRALALHAAGMGVWDWNPVTGELHWDERVARLHGVDPASFDGQMETFLERIHPDDQAQVQAAIQQALATGQPYAAEFRVLHPDGTTAWIQGRGQAFLDEAGAPQRMIGVGLDTTALRSLRERAGRSLDHIGDGIALLDVDWRILYVNDSAGRLLGRDRADLLGTVLWEEFPDAVGTRFWHEYRTAMQTQQPTVFSEFYGPLDGWFEIRCFPAPDGLTVYFRDVNAEREADDERARLLEAEQHARFAAETAQRRLALIADASSALAGSLDPDEVQETLTRLLVPRFADWAVLYRRAPEGLEAVASAGDVPGVPRTRAPAQESPLLRSVQDSGEGVLIMGPEAVAEALADIGLSSAGPTRQALIVALSSGGQPLGVLALGTTGRPPLDDDDLTIAEEVAGRAALALQNALLFSRERQVSDALQRAVLPDRLPAVAGYDLAARYVPATAGLTVGGDWYDAFPVGERLGLAVGDVAGHGLRAAAVMGQLRNALRAYALEQGGPERAFAAVSALLATLEPEEMATLAYAELEPATGELTWVSAGHPPPVLVPRQGEPRLVEGPVEPPLGALLGDQPVRLHRLRLGEGDRLVWYTDGLIERRSASLDVGLGRLIEAAASAPTEVDGLCGHLVSVLLEDGGSQDDVCILAIHRLASGASAPPG